MERWMEMDPVVIRTIVTPQSPILPLSKSVFCVINFAQIVIGALYLEDCPGHHYIPIYLIVLGVFGFMFVGLSYLPCAHVPNPPTTQPTFLSRLYTLWNTSITLFLFCWFVTGNVWIYSVYEPNYDQSTTGDGSGTYCNKTLYLFAFWTTTVFYILLSLLIFGGFCAFIVGRVNHVNDISANG